jgi:hypothetical protein
VTGSLLLRNARLPDPPTGEYTEGVRCAAGRIAETGPRPPGPRWTCGRGRAPSRTGGHGDSRTHARDDHPRCAGLGRVADGADTVRAAARDELRQGAHHSKVTASERIGSTQYPAEELRAIVEEAEAADRYVAAHAYTVRARSPVAVGGHPLADVDGGGPAEPDGEIGTWRRERTRTCRSWPTTHGRTWEHWPSRSTSATSSRAAP